MLRLFAIKEEISRAELAQQNRRLQRIEHLVESLREQDHSSRMGLIANIEERGAAEPIGETMGRLARAKGEELTRLIPAQRAKIAAAANIFVESRQTKMQMEALLKQSEARLRQEQERRRQTELDEWAARRHLERRSDDK